MQLAHNNVLNVETLDSRIESNKLSRHLCYLVEWNSVAE